MLERATVPVELATVSSCIAAVEGALVLERRGERVAVHDFGGRDVVWAVPTTFGIPLPYSDGVLASAGGHALSVFAEGGATQVAATPLVAGREAIPREISLGGAASVAAVGRGYVLLSISGRPVLVHVGRGMLAHAALLDVSAMSWAVALPDDRFLLRSTAGLELVAAAARRVERRLRIDVPATSPVVGAASGGARIWALTPDRRELAVYRLSDGKRQRISLGEAATSFVGHLESSWVIAEIGARLWAINLVSEARLALELPPGPGCALIPRGSGALLVRATGAAPEVWQLEHGGAFTGLPGGASAPA
ncbi:MAG: hypothetical protein DYG91_14775, partial [Chloroflexi bacterium CFX7]|nr:hypothetical protein [Chloroflexi bacterium CFX7]